MINRLNTNFQQELAFERLAVRKSSSEHARPAILKPIKRRIGYVQFPSASHDNEDGERVAKKVKVADTEEVQGLANMSLDN